MNENKRKYKNYLKTKDVNNEFLISQMAKIYNFPTYSSTNAIVAIPSFGGGLYGNIENNVMTNGDAQQYWSLQGIAPENMSTVYVVYPNGATNDLSNKSGTLENTLDISVVGSCCQCIIILFIFKNTTSFTESFQTMFNGINVNGKQLIPTIISYSWGMSEIYADMNDIIQTNLLLKNKNINVCAATGDYGSSNGTSSINVDFPSSSPYVTAVGGTSLICPNYVYDDQTVETVWNDKSAATGGGISKIFAKPAYQNFIPGTKRNTPDIAFNSDPGTGIQLYYNGKIAYGIGGTSLAAPFFAGFIALSDIKTFINPLLYSNSCYNDIKLGSNATNVRGYSAKLGYDNCSGIGSMDCSKFVKNPYISLPRSINITLGQIANIPIKTNLNVSWEISNKNISISGNFMKGNSLGTSIIRARVNNLFATMQINIVKPAPLLKMRFTR